ncbi:hypothetical protein L249_8268 [Ophiocordyceps polyrhachis-furcata BCC 54312]|uniref:Protein kinase domain-containing protein n=1 Tax=Ophiocordyceps polyrhachis-furcata BCC 54312 TaxID=1330021 RepID=A0A367LHJ6_9HYPO|nr:hypothetical protein L249_8268 [Ophiocordyceps polyrhachis-furcata BCC 54312]
MDDLEVLRRRIRDVESERDELKRQGDEEKRRADEEKRRADEEKRLREAAEKAAEPMKLLTLEQYLESCHSIHLGIQVETRKSRTTQGVPTNPVGRILPRRIIPWDDFATKQEETWNGLSISDLFRVPAFPSQHQLDYVSSFLRPISSELGLRRFEHDVVENAVQKLFDRVNADPLLRNSLGLQGTVTFESHTNFGTLDDDPLSESMEHLSLSQGPTPARKPKARRRAKGKGSLADQYCIYRTAGNQDFPMLAIEYKAPHKLTMDQVVTGLASEIQPQRDVINKDGQGFTFQARRLTAAVVTQLFSYMIGKGMQYGYICTGETLVFLYIPKDPSTVYVSVCVPNQDVMDDDETRLHRTAVAQVFAFILRALRAEPLPESWFDEAEKLETWAVEYDDILRHIPETERKKGKEPHFSPYKPQSWKGFQRSPIRTRSRCQPPDPGLGRPSDDDEDDGPPSPTPGPRRTVAKAAPSTGTGSGGGKKSERGRDKQVQSPPTTKSAPTTKPNIRIRPYCSQDCLLGLAHGGPMDKNCPNADDHGQKHISRAKFLRLVRSQLATDRGCDADCAALHLTGARGSLFKVRLSSHGYTLVAKGVEEMDLDCLQHETDMYKRLRPIQGKHVPVCLGIIDLVLPYYYDSGVYVHFMFLSWGGQSVLISEDPAIKSGMDSAVGTILKAVHGLRVLHRDAEPRNIVYDESCGRFMFVDFERAEFRGRQRQPLGSVAVNVASPDGKRKRGTLEEKEKQKGDDKAFARELDSAKYMASRYTARL